jgi:cytoskeletal protein CcmA (bactofilin family)
MSSTETKTVIGSKTKITGEITGAENLTIDGQVEGIIRLEGASLTVRPEGIVRAAVTAQEIIVMGRLEGEVHSTGLLHLRGNAVVHGDIFAARLAIEDGATLKGTLDPSRASESHPA